METLVFDIERFALHDGPGIRTVVFLKGCPLHCRWCHNPESQEAFSDLLFSPEKCVGCGWCFRSCPNGCHTVENGVHRFHRETCTHCGKCTEKCHAGALEKIGRNMSVDEVMEEVLKDRIFYETSGGGLTLSGGEPLMHPVFSRQLLEAAKRARIHTCVETSGFAEFSVLTEWIPLVDLWLWDYKAPEAKHAALTGVPRNLIMENLRLLDSAGARITLRCPLVPGRNDSPDDLRELAKTAASIQHLEQIDLEPYHALGENKKPRLGRDDLFPVPPISETWLQGCLEILRKNLNLVTAVKLTRA